MIGQRWQIQFFLLFLSSTAGSLPRGRWQSEMKKNSKLGHEREQRAAKKEWKTQREIVENEIRVVVAITFLV